MIIIREVDEIIKYRKQIEINKQTVGFVPTMGALHEGHLSIIKQSINENDITIVSIYVNPKQFNEQQDFEKYPRNENKDIELLQKINCTCLFLPQTEDIYSNYKPLQLDFKQLDTMYEGEYRSGHFQGVVDIVSNLFKLTRPSKAYFGEKDYQQLIIIKLLVEQLHFDIDIVAVPTYREQSGLALSSRNLRLSTKGKEEAQNIYKILNETKSSINVNDSPEHLIEVITNKINNFSLLKTEYVVFCDAKSLEEIKKFHAKIKLRLCIAVWCENVRLIDNIGIDFF